MPGLLESVWVIAIYRCCKISASGICYGGRIGNPGLNEGRCARCFDWLGMAVDSGMTAETGDHDVLHRLESDFVSVCRDQPAPMPLVARLGVGSGLT
jgi:hypothetical protein